MQGAFLQLFLRLVSRAYFFALTFSHVLSCIYFLVPEMAPANFWLALQVENAKAIDAKCDVLIFHVHVLCQQSAGTVMLYGMFDHIHVEDA